jgi:hypothetical protein
MPLTLTRSLVVVLAPGIVAAAPWLLWIVKEWENAARLYQAFPSLITALLFAIVVVLGSVFEGISSLLEFRWDEEREVELDVKKHWYTYLARICPTEPVAHNYLSRMAATLYFELAMIWATSLFFLGIVVLLWSAQGPISTFVFVALIIAAISSPVYFWWQARCSHKVLCQTRREINELISM